MFQLGQPWLLVLLLLPLVARFLAPAHRERKAAVRSPFFAQLSRLTGVKPSRGAVVMQRNVGQRLLLPLVWALTVLALAQPQWVGEPIERVESARDLMLVVDLSVSMQERDFLAEGGERISRLEAVKDVLRGFVERRSTDRVGLIVFGQAAFLQVPFTLDHQVFLQLLDELEIGLAGPRTMMGDAIGLAIRAFDASEAEERLAIVLTDGNDTGSKVPPLKAAEIAATRQLRLHTIGVGDPASVGEAPLDEEALTEIAEATGGRFFRAEDRGALEAVYAEIDAQEPLEFDRLSYRPTFELYHWPLAACLLLILAYHAFMSVWIFSVRARSRGAARA
jgi:Ca-activated chloride channel family protein